MSENWPYKITHVTPGEPVDAGIVSRPDRALAERTEYLKERLLAAEAGKAIFDIDATVSSDVLPGHAVYWNSAEMRYEPAMAVVETDTASQALVVRPSSNCVGLCYKKTAENKADIVLSGVVTFKNLTNAIGPTVEPGKYYLSASVAGKLSQQKPPVTVTVCYVLGPRDNCSDDLKVIVCPQVRDSLDEHTHFRFDLVTKPAGTIALQTVDGEQRVVVTGNANLPGWLPANHSIFNGKAPAGAKFGYNLSKHPALQRVWPPIPIQSVAMLWDKGEERRGATEIPLGPTGAAIVDVNGIWWMSDCYDPTDVPWPANYDAAEPATGQCPREEKMRVIIVFLRLLLGNNRRVVTSLDRDDTSPLVITNCDGVVSQTGDLKLDLDLQELDCAPLTNEDHELGPNQGGKVYTQVVAADTEIGNKNTLKKSWVTEGVIFHNSSQASQLSVHGTWERNLTNNEKVYHGFVDQNGLPIAAPVKAQQGLIRLDFSSEFTDREIEPQIIRLNDAVERLYLDIPYLGFPQGQDSSIRLRFNIPYYNVAGSTLQMKIRAHVFTRGGNATTADIGNLYMTQRVIPPPDTAPINLVELEEADLSFPTNIAAPRDTLVKADSGSFIVQPGATVLVTLSRPGEDAALGEIGILRVSGLLSLPTGS